MAQNKKKNQVIVGKIETLEQSFTRENNHLCRTDKFCTVSITYFLAST